MKRFEEYESKTKNCLLPVTLIGEATKTSTLWGKNKTPVHNMPHMPTTKELKVPKNIYAQRKAPKVPKNKSTKSPQPKVPKGSQRKVANSTSENYQNFQAAFPHILLLIRNAQQCCQPVKKIQVTTKEMYSNLTCQTFSKSPSKFPKYNRSHTIV